MSELNDGSVSPSAASESVADSSAHHLKLPETAQISTIQAAEGVLYHLDFSLAEALIAASETDLVFQFEQDQLIILQDFLALSAAENPPKLVLPDGQIIVGGVELQALLGDELEPAAATPVASGGVGEYDDDLGAALEGVDKLGTLGSGFSSREVTQTEATLSGQPADVVFAEVPVDTNPPVANAEPVAFDDLINVTEDMVFSGDLSTNDSPSADGGNVWALASGPANGTVVVNPLGTL